MQQPDGKLETSAFLQLDWAEPDQIIPDLCKRHEAILHQVQSLL